MSDPQADDQDFAKTLISAALALAAEAGWAAVSPYAAASRAKLSPERARKEFPGRAAILLGLGRWADTAALEKTPDDGSVRDKLFDLLMRRVDLLQSHRAGVLALMKTLPTDPATALLLACATERSMAWMLEAAGVSASGLTGMLRAKGLTGIWLWTIRTWEHDDSEDLAATMSALDQALARVEPFARYLARPAPHKPAAEPDISSPAGIL